MRNRYDYEYEEQLDRTELRENVLIALLFLFLFAVFCFAPDLYNIN